MGIDPERDPITVIGIGDMSGDVFGNGLLLSSSIRLIAAFNHRHIFIDPNPDPERSFKERRRLFDLGRSQWTDYRTDALSTGAGIYDRNARRISLSAEARATLGVGNAEMSGEELIRHILCAEVDLLWNGGIGTYIKASSESHGEVSDKDNDGVRVDATALRCKVVGEGGNLGVTMRGRVEYALAGGRVNLDAIDNSGGVDLSDHEVNLKTLLRPLTQDGTLAHDARDALLVEVGDEICDAVLANSRLQALGLSLDQVRSRRNIWTFSRSLFFLRAETGFSRRIERLPRGAEAMEQRQARGQGLMRPELAKLSAFAKMYAYRALVAKPIGTREQLLTFFSRYFPAKIVEEYGDTLPSHMLFDEIAATVQVNHIVGMGGLTFYPTLVDETERGVDEITAVYFIVKHLLDTRSLVSRIHALDGVAPTDGQYQALVAIQSAIREGIVTILSERHTPASLAWLNELETGLPLATALSSTPRDLLPTEALEELNARIEELEAEGVPTDLARDISTLHHSAQGFALTALAHRLKVAPTDVGRHFYEVGYTTGILPLRAKILEQVYRDDWDQRAIGNIGRALYQSLCELTELSLKGVLVGSHRSDMLRFGEEVADLLKARVPVSATFVLSERLRQRIRILRG